MPSAKISTKKTGKGKIISVIMPTLNSEKTIEKSLKSIRAQNFPQSSIEIMVVDAGSSDKTVRIAKKYKAVVLPNPKVQQEYAKHIGLLKAKGKYAMFLDSDEVLSNKDAIKNRVNLMEKRDDIKIVLTGGYKKPEGFSNINDYITAYSDPFAYFMYGISPDADLYLDSQSHKRYVKIESDTPTERIMCFKERSIRPLVDLCAGNTIDLAYLRKKFAGMMKDDAIVPKAFYLITNDKKTFAIMKNDYIIHYSADSFKKYLNKIRWRVIVNIHYKKIPGTGFSNREEFEPLSFRIKKYLFIPYGLTLVLPFLTSLVFAIFRKSPVLLLHAPYCFYTAFQIIHYYILKLLGIKPQLRSYGAETKVLKV